MDNKVKTLVLCLMMVLLMVNIGESCMCSKGQPQTSFCNAKFGEYFNSNNNAIRSEIYKHIHTRQRTRQTCTRVHTHYVNIPIHTYMHTQIHKCPYS